LRLRFRHPIIDLFGSSQIDIAPVGSANSAILTGQPAHDGGSDHTFVARHEHALTMKGIGFCNELSQNMRLLRLSIH